MKHLTSTFGDTICLFAAAIVLMATLFFFALPAQAGGGKETVTISYDGDADYLDAIPTSIQIGGEWVDTATAPINNPTCPTFAYLPKLSNGQTYAFRLEVNADSGSASISDVQLRA